MAEVKLNESLNQLLKNHNNLRNIALHCESLWSTPDSVKALSNPATYQENIKAASTYAVQGLSALVYQVNQAVQALNSSLESQGRSVDDLIQTTQSVTERFNSSTYLVGKSASVAKGSQSRWRYSEGGARRDITPLYKSSVDRESHVKGADQIWPQVDKDESFASESQKIDDRALFSIPPPPLSPPPLHIIERAKSISRPSNTDDQDILPTEAISPFQKQLLESAKKRMEAAAIRNALEHEKIDSSGENTPETNNQQNSSASPKRNFSLQEEILMARRRFDNSSESKEERAPTPQQYSHHKVQSTDDKCVETEVERPNASPSRKNMSFQEELLLNRRRIEAKADASPSEKTPLPDVSIPVAPPPVVIKSGGGPPPPPPPPPLGFVAPIPTSIPKTTRISKPPSEPSRSMSSTQPSSFQEQLKLRLAQKAAQESSPSMQPIRSMSMDPPRFEKRPDSPAMDFQAQLRAKLKSREEPRAISIPIKTETNVEVEEEALSPKEKWKKLEAAEKSGPLKNRETPSKAIEKKEEKEEITPLVVSIMVTEPAEINEEYDVDALPQNIRQKTPSPEPIPTKKPTAVRAVADFEPSGPGQLSIRVGDMIKVHSWEFGEGWAYGESDGQSPGIFPHSYVVDLDE
ncbi:hypothetical protein HDU97_009242 [Phlyctochytrium planicorne]|nr:hypothetical protein HDU97_009242 [Phlyctochytrium planicorne]